jgi:hypothetical protein
MPKGRQNVDGLGIGVLRLGSSGTFGFLSNSNIFRKVGL